MKLSGWGKYPVAESQAVTPRGAQEAGELLSRGGFSGIARGLGRSYGDSALAPFVLSSGQLGRFIDFDETTGKLTCGAGISLAQILEVFVPRGWFPAVTPGTKFVTVGGAIASDVHGKNHHGAGSFSDHVESFRLALADGEIVTCSRQDNADLFRATCGGMGLTGVILDATLNLTPVRSSFIRERTIKAVNLADCLELFDLHDGATYSVAWVDCLAKGESLGRSLLMLGAHSEEGGFAAPRRGGPSVPFDMPRALLNPYSVKAFNALYYGRVRAAERERLVHYEPYFYPLDAIANWNRLYGRQGFVQYQFALPREAGLEGMTTAFRKIVESAQGSFLSVLKAFGPGNDNLLSFPIEGYTLALDFKVSRRVLALLDELDRVVLDYGGRVYLTKDARMSEAVFKQSYPQWEAFRAIRERYGADKVFNSLQSKRLGI